MEENIFVAEEDKKPNRNIIPIIIAVSLLVGIFLFAYYFLFSAPNRGAKSEQFVVSINMKTDQALSKLESSGFIRNSWAFNLVLRMYDWRGTIAPGSYDLSKGDNIFTIVKVLTQPPHSVWVVIPEGFRKEEIAEVVSRAIGWSEENKIEFITVSTNQKPDQFEGVYFPDTYLISRNSTPKDVAKKLYSHFQEKFEPLAGDAIKQNIKWTTVLKVASLIQREGKNMNDMSIISAVIWNRLENHMKLQVDATVQYARGNTGNGWWAPITKADIAMDSPYNTYAYTGLPPTPIANPGIGAINAALHPASTKCLYYIHDSSGLIHCSENYKGQQDNINKYLR